MSLKDDDTELGITDEDREKMAEMAKRGPRRGGRDPEPDRQQLPQWADGPPALPCGCGPGVNNIMDTASDLDYECPRCGATFTREEVKDL